MRDATYVYAIRILGTPYLKIGPSFAPKQRCDRLRWMMRGKGTPYVVCTCRVSHGGTYERVLHRYFSSVRILHEWFGLQYDADITAAMQPARLQFLLRFYVREGMPLHFPNLQPTVENLRGCP